MLHNLCFKAACIDAVHVLHQDGAARYVGVLAESSMHSRTLIFVNKVQKQLRVADIWRSVAMVVNRQQAEKDRAGGQNN